LGEDNEYAEKLMEKPLGKQTLGKSRNSYQDNMKMGIKVELAQDSVMWRLVGRTFGLYES
jgi:hypothetical protein